MSKQCYYSEDGVMRKHFVCSLDQECCDLECCEKDFTFYQHWYFWLSVAILLMFVIAAVISGYCRHRQPPPSPYVTLGKGGNSDGEMDTQTTVIPWAVALGSESECSTAVSGPNTLPAFLLAVLLSSSIWSRS